MIRWVFLVFASFLVIVSCKQPFSDEKEYYQYLNQESSGLIKSKTIGDIKLSVKYLPGEFLAYKELKAHSYTSKQKDSLISYYNKSLTFLLTIAPDALKGGSGDIMYKGIASEKEFKERVSLLNFHMADYIDLKVGGKVYVPVFAVMENTYSSSEPRNFYLTFNDGKNNLLNESSKELDIVFSDEIFETGISHFLFEKEDLKNIPTIGFWKN